MRSVTVFMLALLSAVACVRETPARVFVHPEYDARRPPMMALEVEGVESARTAVGEAVYEALIAKNYTVLAPGEPRGPEMGVARVVISAASPKLAAALSIFNAKEDRVFRSEGAEPTAEDLADRLTRSLPAK